MPHAPPLCVLVPTPAIHLPTPTDPPSYPPLRHKNSGAVAVALPEATHHTHAAYLADIASRTALALSCLTASFHWRAHALLLRAVAFHSETLKAGGKRVKGAVVRVLENDDDNREQRKVGEDVVVSGAVLVALKVVLGTLGVERVSGTVAWIEDQEIGERAVRLEAACLGAGQRWCSGCGRVFYVTNKREENYAPMTRNPMGVRCCGHVLCRECVVEWFDDVDKRGWVGLQPCCGEKILRRTTKTLLEGIPE